MSKRQHYSTKTGKMETCSAKTPESCAYSGTPHFDDGDPAGAEYAKQRNKESNSLLAGENRPAELNEIVDILKELEEKRDKMTAEYRNEEGDLRSDPLPIELSCDTTYFAERGLYFTDELYNQAWDIIENEDKNSETLSLAKEINTIWNDKNLLEKMNSTGDYMEYLEKLGINCTKEEFDDAFDLAATFNTNSTTDENKKLIINGNEFYDRSDANKWLNEKTKKYGNTYHFPSKDRETLNKLIEKFGNTYFWSK